jgi:hypothetical protein
MRPTTVFLSIMQEEFFKRTFLHIIALIEKLGRTRSRVLPALRDFKMNFSRPLFTIILRPKIVFLVTDSILRAKTKYESVK